MFEDIRRESSTGYMSTFSCEADFSYVTEDEDHGSKRWGHEAMAKKRKNYRNYDFVSQFNSMTMNSKENLNSPNISLIGDSGSIVYESYGYP